MTARRAALFDMDRTLVRKETASLYVRYQVESGEASWADLGRTLYWAARYTLGILDTERVADLMRRLRRRRPAFTPDWADPVDIDAGGALVQLFSEELAAVIQRLNRLPDKTRLEFLSLGGVTPVPALPAEALIQFTVAPAAKV